MGVLIFGLVIANQKSYWGAAVGFAMLGFGLTAASNVVVTYAVDAYRPVSTTCSGLGDETDSAPSSDLKGSLGCCVCGEKSDGLRLVAILLIGSK